MKYSYFKVIINSNGLKIEKWSFLAKWKFDEKFKRKTGWNWPKNRVFGTNCNCENSIFGFWINFNNLVLKLTILPTLAIC